MPAKRSYLAGQRFGNIVLLGEIPPNCQFLRFLAFCFEEDLLFLSSFAFFCSRISLPAIRHVNVTFPTKKKNTKKNSFFRNSCAGMYWRIFGICKNILGFQVSFTAAAPVYRECNTKVAKRAYVYLAFNLQGQKLSGYAWLNNP